MFGLSLVEAAGGAELGDALPELLNFSDRELKNERPLPEFDLRGGCDELESLSWAEPLEPELPKLIKLILDRLRGCCGGVDGDAWDAAAGDDGDFAVEGFRTAFSGYLGSSGSIGACCLHCCSLSASSMLTDLLEPLLSLSLSPLSLSSALSLSSSAPALSRWSFLLSFLDLPRNSQSTSPLETPVSISDGGIDIRNKEFGSVD